MGERLTPTTESIMADKQDKHQTACRAPAGKQPFDWDNYLGITAPSETAKSSMESEGYLNPKDAQWNKAGGRSGKKGT
jgi:hypothetical protein